MQAWFFDHRSQGGGDPRRTSSGKITTTFTLDPSIHFHGNEDKNEILSFVRYRCSGPATQKYRDELGRTASLACLYPLSLTSETCSRLSRCCTRHACLTAFIQSPHLISNVSLSAFLSLTCLITRDPSKGAGGEEKGRARSLLPSIRGTRGSVFSLFPAAASVASVADAASVIGKPSSCFRNRETWL